jgi:tRNA(fMet)-specific endonuclease VapC
MNLLLDTNILIICSQRSYIGLIDRIFDAFNDRLFISITVLAELKSIALQNGWGDKKWQPVEDIIASSVLVEINETLLDTYMQIDAYSQKRNPYYTNYPFTTPRNMGKNDIWIAATAALLGLTLVTADNDFDHLNNVFLQTKKISLQT